MWESERADLAPVPGITQPGWWQAYADNQNRNRGCPIADWTGGGSELRLESGHAIRHRRGSEVPPKSRTRETDGHCLTHCGLYSPILYCDGDDVPCLVLVSSTPMPRSTVRSTCSGARVTRRPRSTIFVQ